MTVLNSGISWCTGTLNLTVGCSQIPVPGGSACDNCLHPDTPILYADMIWRPIGQAKPGDEIVGLDEHPGSNRRRKLRPAVIEHVWWHRKPITRIVTAHQDIATTAEHPWLLKDKDRWIDAGRLRPGRDLRYIGQASNWLIDQEYKIGYIAGMTAGDGTFRYRPGQRSHSHKNRDPQAYWRVALTDPEPLGRLVTYLCELGIEAWIRPFPVSTGRHHGPSAHYRPMEKVEIRALSKLSALHNLITRPLDSDGYARGWLAGFFDAEGEGGVNLRVSQTLPLPMVRFAKYAKRFGFNFQFEEWDNHTDTMRLAERLRSRIRFFGETRPAITRKMAYVFDKTCYTEAEKILCVEQSSPRDVVDIQTTTHTFYAAGSPTHNCYAKALVNRGLPGMKRSRDFGELSFHGDRLRDLRKFAPGINAAGEREPKMVFVNSLSDFWHEAIPDQFIHDCLDAFEQHPKVILQILTKRPVRMRKIMAARYANGTFPQNIWLGVSAESNAVAARLNILRRLKDQVGDFCAFVSVEPIFAATDQLDFTGCDWILSGGESGLRARPMPFEALQAVHDQAMGRQIPLHFKQYGHALNNPLVRQALWAGGAEPSHVGTTASPVLSRDTKAAWEKIKADGLELAPDEKGGATYKGRVIQEKPAHFYALKATLQPPQMLL